MTINKVAYLSVPSFKKLENYLNKKNIDYSYHTDGADEKEIWIEVDDCTLNTLSGEFLNKYEYEQCVEENVEYIIFYE